MDKFSGPFGFPETSESSGVYLAQKSRKLSDGKFEAVAAIFAWTFRGTQIYAVAHTRSAALTAVINACEKQSSFNRLMIEGKISLATQA